MGSLIDVEGIGPVYRQKLTDAGISSANELLERGSTPRGRQQVAAETGIGPALLLEWINHVDLFRIKGIYEEYADLLEEAGVDTVPELAQRNPDSLYARMGEVNAQKSLVRRLPSRNQVADWIQQARTLPRKISY
jgi:predicted flap endonuclease-1-like 5' DNA nuclease